MTNCFTACVGYDKSACIKHHKAISPWEGEPAYDKETEGLAINIPTFLEPSSFNSCNAIVIAYEHLM